MAAGKKNRWYDAHPQLAKLLESIKRCDQFEKRVVLNGLHETVTTLEPGLIDRTVMDYPMTYKRRWYDRDPVAWMAINGLKYARASTVRKATTYLKGVMN